MKDERWAFTNLWININTLSIIKTNANFLWSANVCHCMWQMNVIFSQLKTFVYYSPLSLRLILSKWVLVSSTFNLSRFFIQYCRHRNSVSASYLNFINILLYLFHLLLKTLYSVMEYLWIYQKCMKNLVLFTVEKCVWRTIF